MKTDSIDGLFLPEVNEELLTSHVGVKKMVIRLRNKRREQTAYLEVDREQMLSLLYSERA